MNTESRTENNEYIISEKTEISGGGGRKAFEILI